jgi:hypothetical protein
MTVRDEECGQVIVFTLLSMTLLLGFLALAIDVGILFRAKRNAQIAADAAAVAGALDYKYNSSVSSAQTAGAAAASANGVTNGTGGAVVAINIPPKYGNYAGFDGFVEAVVTQPNSTFFMGMLSGKTSTTVGSRAVAGSGSGAGCIWTLARSGSDVSLTGSGALTASMCKIYDDSSASNALKLTGSGSISALSIGVAGNYSETGSGSINPTPVTGMAPAANPLNLTPPAIPTGTCSSNCNPSFSGSTNNSIGPGTYTSISNSGSGTLTLTPGNYIINGNLSNTGSGSLILGAGNYTISGNFTTTGSGSLTLGSGEYIVGGNLGLTGSGALTGTSVSFYTEGGSTITGSGSEDLTAPTSGPYNGVLIYQPPGDTQAVSLTGSGSAIIQGIVYAPGAAMTLTGSGSMTVSLDIIVDSLSLTGSGSITDTNYAVVTNPNSVLGKLAMVE